MKKENAISTSDEVLVVTFDICSSTSILEDLILSNNINSYLNLLQKLKDYLLKSSQKLNFTVYKFLGDGWILIFPLDSLDKNFMIFIKSIFKNYLTLKKVYLDPVLGNMPPLMGMTMGINHGITAKILMNNQIEYVGRPINIACRLQGAIGQKDQEPSNKVLISRSTYTFLKDGIEIDFTPYNPQVARRSLKNIQGGNDFRCMKLTI